MQAVDAELRLLLEQGSVSEALALLHRLYAGDVRRFATYLHASRSVDDVCQDVWIAAGRALPAFRFEAAPRTWLFAITRRCVAGRGRRRVNDRLVPLPSSVETLERSLLAAPTGVRRPSNPSSRLRRRRRAAVLEEELAALDAADRELIELRFMEDLKPADIVDVLGLDAPANTVSQRLVRLVRRLRERLMLHPEFGSARR